jgi:hypothetical protein
MQRPARRMIRQKCKRFGDRIMRPFYFKSAIGRKTGTPFADRAPCRVFLLLMLVKLPV